MALDRGYLSALEAWKAQGIAVRAGISSGQLHGVDCDGLAVAKKKMNSCGVAHDRDENAAINLEHLAVSSTVTACGSESSGRAA